MEKTAVASCGGGEDFMIEILVRLPVVSLLRFNCVCKSWRHLIQTSFFINLHTTTTFNSSSSSSSSSNSKQQLGGGGGGFILQAQHYDRSFDLRRSDILVLSSESSSGCGSDHRYIDDDVSLYKLKLPPCGIIISTSLSCGEVIAGSCNGLICFVTQKNRYMYDHPKQYMAISLWLWNPATRQSRTLPKSLTTTSFSYFSQYYTEISRVSFHFVAFGFDVQTNDYKLMQITYLRHTTTTTTDSSSSSSSSCQVQVYSLSTNSWRLLEGINSLPGIPKKDWLHQHHGLYLNGSYFFVATAPNKSLSSSSSSSSNDDNNHHHCCFIISFDFTKDIFNTIQLPPDHHHHHHVHGHGHGHHVVQKKKKMRWYLSCLGDKLALFTIREYDDYGYEDCDIWVLNENENGGKEEEESSWTKLHSFQIKRRGEREWIIPRGILMNNGEFALLETTNTDETETRIQFYNLATKEAKTGFPICKGVQTGVRTVLAYKPSLVSITDGRNL